jgi:putative endonuclease
MTFVYIPGSSDGLHFYTGATQDLRERIGKHNAGDVPHTARFRPWRLKTYAAQAWAFVRYLKTASGRAFSRKRL